MNKVPVQQPSDVDVDAAIRRNQETGAQRVREHEERIRREAVEQVRRGSR